MQTSQFPSVFIVLYLSVTMIAIGLLADSICKKIDRLEYRIQALTEVVESLIPEQKQPTGSIGAIE